MNEQLELLLILQDLDLLMAEMADRNISRRVRRMGFEIDGREKVEESRQLIADKLDSPLLHHYERLHDRFGRAIVPVRDGICLGCFVRQPATRKQTALDLPINTCQRCQRFLLDLKIFAT